MLMSLLYLSILDTTDSEGYVDSIGSLPSRNIGINPLRCNDNETRLDNCEGFHVYENYLKNNFVHISCNGELQAILSELY